MGLKVLLGASLVLAVSVAGCDPVTSVVASQKKNQSQRQLTTWAQVQRKKLHIQSLHQDVTLPGETRAYMMLVTKKPLPPGAFRCSELTACYVDVFMAGSAVLETISVRASVPHRWPQTLDLKVAGENLRLFNSNLDPQDAGFYSTTPVQLRTESKLKETDLDWRLLNCKDSAKVKDFTFREDLYDKGEWCGSLFAFRKS